MLPIYILILSAHFRVYLVGKNVDHLKTSFNHFRYWIFLGFLDEVEFEEN